MVSLSNHEVVALDLHPLDSSAHNFASEGPALSRGFFLEIACLFVATPPALAWLMQISHGSDAEQWLSDAVNPRQTGHPGGPPKQPRGRGGT